MMPTANPTFACVARRACALLYEQGPWMWNVAVRSSVCGTRVAEQPDTESKYCTGPCHHMATLMLCTLNIE
jgi:hypothetical protein